MNPSNWTRAKTVTACIVVVIAVVIFCAGVHRLIYTRAEIVYTTIQDDSFYYILPAWNAFHHGMISFDLINKTYGFQPGYFLALYALSPLATNAHGLTVISIVFNLLCYAATSFIVYYTIRSASPAKSLYAGITAGVVGCTAFLANGLNYLSSQTGKENALAALLLAIAVYLSHKLRSHDSRGSSLVGFSFFGVILALFALTRIHPSTAISMIILTLYSVNLKIFSRKTIAIGISFSIAFIPWFIFAKYYFGNMFPTSGELKSSPFELDAQGISSYLGYLQTYFERILKFSSGYPNSFFLLQTDVGDFTPQAKLPAKLMAWTTISSCIVAVIYALLPSKSSDPGFKSFTRVCCLLLVGSLVGHAALLWNYAHWAYAVDYFTWYIYDTPLIVSLMAGCGTAWIVSLWKTGFLANARYLAALLAIPVLACCWCIVRDARPQTIYPYGGFQGIAYGITQDVKNGKYPQCRNVLVGSYSSGLIGLELDGKVVNLDGLANDTAARIRMKGDSIPALLSKQKIGCFIEISDLLPQHEDYETTVLGEYPMGDKKIVVASLRHHTP